MLIATVIQKLPKVFEVSINQNGAGETTFPTPQQAINFAKRLFDAKRVSSYVVYVDGYSLQGKKEAE